MVLIREVIWEQVFPEDAELRIQKAFEMLLGEELGLTNNAHLGTAIDQRFLKDYNQVNEKATNDKRNRHAVEDIQKVSP